MKIHGRRTCSLIWVISNRFVRIYVISNLKIFVTRKWYETPLKVFFLHSFFFIHIMMSFQKYLYDINNVQILMDCNPTLTFTTNLNSYTYFHTTFSQKAYKKVNEHTMLESKIEPFLNISIEMLFKNCQNLYIIVYKNKIPGASAKCVIFVSPTCHYNISLVRWWCVNSTYWLHTYTWTAYLDISLW